MTISSFIRSSCYGRGAMGWPFFGTATSSADHASLSIIRTAPLSPTIGAFPPFPQGTPFLSRRCRAATKRWPIEAEIGYAQSLGRGIVVSMAEDKKKPVTIKKYAHRRLYNSGTSTYVTLEDLAAMVKSGDDFIVYDAKTGEDITRSVLAQIIFEQENKEGQSLLPITFLRQLIRFYGDSMQMLVPRFLEASIESLSKEQGKFREQMAQAFGVGAFGPLEDQVRRNMEMFERAFAMFMPFARREAQNAEA